MQVLGIEVSQSLIQQWRAWLAPPAQPFFLSEDQAEACALGDSAPRTSAISGELRDTYAAYRVARSLQAVWLDEQAFSSAPRPVRGLVVRAQVEHRRALVPTVRRWAGAFAAEELRAQADGHRFVWWPPMLEQADDALVGRIVTWRERLLPSRHSEVPRQVWTGAGPVLPAAEELAGTFPAGSGPNCFGTVMAAAGVAGAAVTQMLQDPFEAWLRDHARAVADDRRAGSDMRAGTVLVWRDRDNAARHAAVTLGGGWALHKPSQSWAAPRKVLTVREVLRVSRLAGLRLHRYALALDEMGCEIGTDAIPGVLCS